MTTDLLAKRAGRREMLRNAAGLASGVFLAQLFPKALYAAVLPGTRGGAGYGAQETAPAADPLAAVRAQMGAMPIQTHKLGENLTLLSGPGGNVVVLNGADGKIVVDTF